MAGCGAAHSPPLACANPNSGGGGSPDTTRARVGQTVYVALVEPEGAMAAGHGFPWARASSSDARVLSPYRVCDTGIYSLPVVWYAFKALRPGSARLSAPLTAAFQAAQRSPRRRGAPRVTLHGYSRTVTVTR